jgi:FG-GAP-like repeat
MLPSRWSRLRTVLGMPRRRRLSTRTVRRQRLWLEALEDRTLMDGLPLVPMPFGPFLPVSTSPLDTGSETESNDSPATANAITPRSQIAAVLGTNDLDYFSFDVTESGQLTATVSASGLAARLGLLGPDGTALVLSDGGAGSGPSIVQHLDPGTYQLVVSAQSGSTATGAYTLNTDFIPAAAPFAIIPTGDSPSALATADFNGDGIPDLAVGNGPSQNLSILLGLGDGTFQVNSLAFSDDKPITSLTAADFDGDGTPGLVVVTSTGGPFSSGPSTVHVIEGSRHQTFDFSVSASAAVGDFNNDQKLDLVIAAGDGTDQNSRLYTYLGQGDGTFPVGSVQQASGLEPFGLVAGDLDGNGTLDLAGTDSSVFLNQGDGTFVQTAVPSSSPLGDNLFGNIVLVDLDGDGLLDRAAVPAGFGFVSGNVIAGSLVIDPGHGDGTFGPTLRVRTQDFATSITSGDFNGDGVADLATDVTVLLGQGDGNFLPELRVNLQDGGGGRVVAADFDGDGRLDLAGIRGGIGVAVGLGRGDGTFQEDARNPVGNGSTSLQAIDLNHDLRDDLVNVNQGTKDLSVLLSRGDGTFEDEQRYTNPTSTRTIAVVAGDFNGDGRPDLAMLVDGVDIPVFPSPPQKLVIFLGLGDGRFQLTTTFDVVSEAFESPPLLVGDFNGDGLADVAVNRYHSTFAGVGQPSDLTVTQGLYLSRGDGTFSDPVINEFVFPQGGSTGVFGASPLTTDLDGDGTLDLILTTSNVTAVALGAGDGTFNRVQTLASTGAVVVGQFDNDGIIDLAIASSSTGMLTVFLGRGDGTFQDGAQTAVPDLAGADRVFAVAGDFNGDGLSDAVVTASRFQAGLSITATVLLGTGAGLFLTGSGPVLGGFLSSLAAGDFDGDGRLDLAASTSSQDEVFLGRGDGSFVDTSLFSSPLPRAVPHLVDVNGDGALDSIVVSGTGDILVRPGRLGEPGVFSAPLLVNRDEPARDVAVVHVGGRVLLAAVLRGADQLALYGLTASGTFAREQVLATGVLPLRVVSGDLNGDGQEDLAVINAGGTGGGSGSPSAPFLSLFYGTPAGGFESESRSLNGPAPVDVLFLDQGERGLAVADQISGAVDLLTGDLLLPGGNAAELPARFLTGAGARGTLTALNGSTVLRSGERLAAVVAGDFNADGLLDLVALNPGVNRFSLLLGTAAGFANPIDFFTDSDPTSAAVGDFNRDGRLDLAVLDQADSTISVYSGDGQGGFSLGSTTFSAGNAALGISAVDVDLDGLLDLQVGNRLGDVLTLLGNGDGTFQPYQRVDNRIVLAVADLQGDGQDDFVLGNPGQDRVAVQFSDPSSSFVQSRGDGLLAPGAVQTADLNGDGILDLAVANSGANTVLVYLGTGGGQFATPQSFFVGTDPVGITIQDLNADLIPDLTVANQGSNDVSVLLGQGTGDTWTLRTAQRLRSGLGPVSTTMLPDVTGDGLAELMVTNSQSGDVWMLPSSGAGLFSDLPASVRIFQAGTTPMQTFVGQFDDLPGLDLVTLNAGSNNLTFFAQATFTNPVTTGISLGSGGQRPLAGLSGDFNFDGRNDLLIANNGDGRLGLFLGGSGGPGLFGTLSSLDLPHPTSLALASLDGSSISFYAVGEGIEAVSTLNFSLEGGLPIAGLDLGGPVSSLLGDGGLVRLQVANLLALNGSSLGIVGTLLTSLEPEDRKAISGEGGDTSSALVLVATLLIGDLSTGDGVLSGGGDGEGEENDRDALPDEEDKKAEEDTDDPATRENFEAEVEEALQERAPLTREELLGEPEKAPPTPGAREILNKLTEAGTTIATSVQAHSQAFALIAAELGGTLPLPLPGMPTLGKLLSGAVEETPAPQSEEAPAPEEGSGLWWPREGTPTKETLGMAVVTAVFALGFHPDRPPDPSNRESARRCAALSRGWSRMAW